MGYGNVMTQQITSTFSPLTSDDEGDNSYALERVTEHARKRVSYPLIPTMNGAITNQKNINTGLPLTL